MIDYADIICQAVDEIVSKRLEGIKYDNTILCTIVDDSKAKAGEYTVTDGATKFIAYAALTDYKINDVVYVTIPNNDHREQKIIIGKQVTNDTTPFIFTTPFDTIVDVSSNLVNGVAGERNLIANNPDIPPEDATQDSDEYYIHQNVKRLVWERNFEDSMVVGFNRLGIQGQFRSWLKPYQAIDGDYGYRLTVTCEKDNHETTIATTKRVLKKLAGTLDEQVWGELQTSDQINWPDEMKVSWSDFSNLESTRKENLLNSMVDHLKGILQSSYAKYDLYLNSKDMYGDPYNFQSFYQQEKVFDISGFGKITHMKLEFYQTPETFLSKKITNQKAHQLLSVDMYQEAWVEVQSLVDWPEKYSLTYEEIMTLSSIELSQLISNMKDYLTLVPYKHPLFNTTLLDPNLFEKDPYVCVGYDLADFNQESAILYTLDSSTYQSGLTDEENTKQVQLRWLHEFEDGEIKQVSNETALDFEVRWYQAELGHPTVDGYAGVNWKRVNLDEHIEVDLSKIVNTMKSYYLIYHDEDGGSVAEADYATGLKIPYTNGRTYTLEEDDISVLSQVDKNWLEKRSLTPFEKNGFIYPSYHMTTINIDLDKQSWTNIFKSQMIFHDADYTKTDSFTHRSYSDVGCLHRVGFWELFTMGYIMYQYCPNEYDQLRVSSIWKNGGTLNETWTKNYARKNLYKDLGCTWPGNGNAANRERIKEILHEFANSFGEWGWYIDPEDNWRDYRPVDEDVYAELYAECLYFYEKTQKPEYDYIAPNFSYTFVPDTEEVEEKVKAVIIYNDKPIYSNIITFVNERPVDNPATLDQINGLNLWCQDDTYGNYRIYSIGGYLEDEDQRNRIRDLQCHFNSKETEASGLLHEATWIMWRVPATGSMIQVTSSEITNEWDYSDVTKNTKFTSFDAISWKAQVPFSIDGIKYQDGIWSGYLYDESTDEIVSIWKGNSANGYFINPILEYKIRSYYSPSDSNNTISCVILKDGVQYETQKEFTFGPVGNSGTDWSFEIDFDNNETALTSGNEVSVTLTARLYDQTNRDVTEDILYDVDVGASLKWSWHKDCYPARTEGNPKLLTSGLELIDVPNKKHKQVISIPRGVAMDSLLYVQCETVGVGDYTLTAILPIPIRKWINNNKHYSHVTGANFVVYPSSGYPHYYNNPFKVHVVNKSANNAMTQTIENGTWQLFNPHNEPEVFLGQMSDKNILQPAAVFSEGTKQYGVQYLKNGQVCWTQPIFTMQNQYPSHAINHWDGKTIEMDYDKGIIMAPAIAAGKKNNDNTFSGVMIGDWSVDDVEEEIAQQTGIYGFDHGAMSYAFKEDGTAFIGKSGFARILIDGNESTIASESYYAGTQNAHNGYGMLIDLDDGFIHILGSEQTGVQTIKTDTTDSTVGYNLTKRVYKSTGAEVILGTTGVPYFRIVADNDHNNTYLIEISNDEYYLQSYNFSDEDKTGLRIDLMNSLMTAYDFTFEGWSDDGVHIRMSTDEEDYFLIAKTSGTNDEIPIIQINDSTFLLQSYNFSDDLNEESGMKIDLMEGTIQAYNFTLDTVGDAEIRIRLSTEEEDYFLISKADKPIIQINEETFLLQTYDFDEADQMGMKMDLMDGSIIAYHFSLEAGTGEKKIFLTSHGEEGTLQGTYPLMIGNPTTVTDISNISLDIVSTEKLFRVDWEGNLIATGARIGGWYFYEGSSSPLGVSSSDGQGWRSMYTVAQSSSIGDGAEYYTVFDPKRDNVIAVGIPTDKAFKNHNYAKFRVLTNGKLFCADAHLGYTPNGNVTLEAKDAGSGWIVTANTIYSNGLTATETSNEDGSVNISYSASTSESDRFTLSTIDFSRSINGTNRSNLRLAIGQNFAVSGAGYVYAKGSNIANGYFSYMNASNATIKTATISTATMTDANITNATLSGTITGTEWNITSDGKATFNNVDMVTGKLGNWSFEANKITNDASTGTIDLGNSGYLKFGTNYINVGSYWVYVSNAFSADDVWISSPKSGASSFWVSNKIKSVEGDIDDLLEYIDDLYDEIDDLWEYISEL